MTSSVSRLAGRVVLVVAVAACALAARQAPRFRSGVDLVQLQVGVVDADGGFPSGLTPGDFVLRIDGEVRPVQVAFEVDLRDREPGPDSAGGTNVGHAPDAAEAGTPAPISLPAAARRHFLIFFDLSFTTRRGLLEARQSALHFLDVQADPSDLIGVATANRFGIQLLAPFTADREVARQAVTTLGLEGATEGGSSGTGFEGSIGQAITEMGASRAGGGGSLDEGVLEAANFRALEADVINYQSQLQAFGEMLQAIEGRKHVLFFSRGISDTVLVGSSFGRARAAPEMLYGSEEVRKGMTDLVENLQRADAAVHAIDTSGLGSSGGGRQSLTKLAVDTGGTPYFNRSDFSAAIEEIEQRTASYYMLGYAKRADDPPTVEVEVRIGAPGFRVVSSPRLLSPPPDYRQMNAAQRQLQVAEALNDGSDRPGILFDSAVVPFPAVGDSAPMTLLVEVPGAEVEALAERRGDDLVELEFFAVALDHADRIVAERRRGVGVALEDLRAAGSLDTQSLRFSDVLEVPPGNLRVRLLLREAQVGWLSARTMRTWIPPDEDLRVVRPLVVAEIDPAPADVTRFDPLSFEGQRLSIALSPTLHPGDRVRLLVGAVGVARDAVTGETTAGLGLEIVDADGQPYPLTRWATLGVTYHEAHDLTQLLLELQVPDSVPTGRAQLWVRFFDRDTGRRAEEQVGIVVQRL